MRVGCTEGVRYLGDAWQVDQRQVDDVGGEDFEVDGVITDPLQVYNQRKRESESEKERERERERDTHTDTERERQRERKSLRVRDGRRRVLHNSQPQSDA